MTENRLEFRIEAAGAEEGIKKLRALKGEMKGVEAAANDDERAFRKVGEGADKAGDKVGGLGRDLKKTGGEARGLESVAVGLSGRLVSLGLAAGAAGASLASIGAVKIAAAFESEFTKVETLLDRSSFAAGNLNDNIAGLRSGVLDLRSSTGETFENLTKGLFDLVSAGVAAEDSLRVLNDANTLAKAGVTDVSVAVDGLTTVINAYNQETDRSTVIASKFFTAQKFGKTTVEELATGIGRVAASAANFGITLDELLASQAAATAAGINQAEAFTGMRAIFGNLVQQEARAREEAKRLGIEFSATAVRAKGLTKFLEEIQASSNFTEKSFENLFRSTEALNFILAITGPKGASVYAKTLAELGDETKSLATLNEAYQRALDDTAEKQKRMQGTVNSLIVAFGAGLAPAFGKVIDNFNEFLRGDDFTARLSQIQEGVASTVGALAKNWNTVEKAITAAATALTVYLGLQLANHLAVVLNLAGAWRAVDKALKAAAVSQALLAGASGLTGLAATARGLTGLAAILGGSVLRSGLALLGRVAGLFGGPISLGIITAVTALVTFRKEIGAAASGFFAFISKAVTGTSDIRAAIEATATVINRRLQPAFDFISDVQTAAFSLFGRAVDAVRFSLVGLSIAAEQIGEKIAGIIPEPVLGAFAALKKIIDDTVDSLIRLGKGIIAFFGSTPIGLKIQADINSISDFVSDVQAEVDRREVAVNAKVVIDRGGITQASELLKALESAGNVDFAIPETTIKSVKDLAGALNDASSAGKALPANVGAVEQVLRDQLTVAGKLAEAAKGGQVRFDAAKAAIELDALAVEAVKKAADAGESLSLETARFLVGKISDLQNAADALLDAEKALRARASDKAGDIAANLQSKISGFFSQRDVQNADLTKPSVVAAIDKQFQKLIDDIDNLSIGLNSDQLQELYKNLDQAGVDWRNEIKAASDYGASRFKDAISGTVSSILDDFVFNGGKNFGRIFNDTIRNFANDNFINPVGDIVSGKGTFGDLKDTLQKSADNFGKAGRSIASSIDKSLAGAGKALGQAFSLAAAGFTGFKLGSSASDLLGITGNKKSQQAGGAIGGGIGAVGGFLVGGPVGALIGTAIGSALGNIIGGLFSKPSANAAGVGFNLETGKIVGEFAKNNDPANIEARDALRDATLRVTQALAELTGGNFGGNNIAISVGNRGTRIESGGRLAFTPAGDSEAAFNEILRQTVLLLQGGEKALVDFAKGALAAGRSAEDVLNILGSLASAFDSGEKAIADYALAAAQAGRSAESISSGVQSLNAALSLSAPKLSEVEQSVKSIGDATNPVIEDLKSLGQSIAGISGIAQNAIRSVGVDFIGRIRDDLDRLSNADLADFKQLLKGQAQDLKDAQLLLSRGGITQDEFRLVEQRNALGQTKFFENLDTDKLNALGDFLGLVRETGGEAAVALLLFNQELDKTKISLTDGLRSLREEADRFLAAATANKNLSKDISLRLSRETGGVQLATLRGELQGLLAQAKTGDVNAAERAPDVARLFIDTAEKYFGASAGLGDARDFVTNILDQIGSVAEQFGNQRLDAISLAEQQVSLLDQIKATLESPDPALDILQGILASGEIQNSTLQQLLDQYVQLSFSSPAQSFTPGQVQQAAQQIVLPSDLKITNTVNTEAPSTVVAINAAAAQANKNAQDLQEIVISQDRRIRELQEAFTKLDSTLRQRV